MKPETFIAKIGSDGRVTIALEIRKKLDLNENDFVEISVSKVNLMSSSMHKLYRQRAKSTVARQKSVTKFDR